MSLFTTQLQKTFDGGGITRPELSRKTGIQYATLSNYATGRSTPDSEAMRAICAVLDAKEAAALTEAWLRDLTEGNLSRLVRVEAKNMPLAAAEPEPWARLPLNAQQREALEKLARAVVNYTEWEQLLYSITDVLPLSRTARKMKVSGTRAVNKAAAKAG
ncbi:Helix-turn-helix protein [Opitutaceae bacterium TAV1]|nr:Helix-turn-helix protein [Opitutaceae bacterium TAV1]